MSQIVLLNLFPANVTQTREFSADTQHRAVRVTVDPQVVTVWGLVDGAPAVAGRAAVASFDKPQRRRRGLDPDYTVTTTGGEVWEIRKAGGCGCGSKLRSFNPFGGANRVGT